jgi:hypothetical protein
MPRRWLALVFAASAVYAVLFTMVSTIPVQRSWGFVAVWGYGLALAALLLPRQVLRGRGTDAALGVAFCGGLLAPLAWLVTKGTEQPDVMVVARAGADLIRHGTPYPSAATLAGTTDPNAYNPYLPVTALFGLPHALVASPLTDPRIWYTLAFVVLFWCALRMAGADDPARWTVLVAGSPVIGFTLATGGGDDAPMIGFLCLGFACLWRRKPVAAGVALGIAAAMKATAWPAFAVALALLAVRDGRRAAARFALMALAIVVVCVGPFLVHPKALIENTIAFPLGLAHVTSAAASPLPGHLIADTGHLGHTIVVVALALAGLGVAASLVFRPPRTVPGAMFLLCGAMTLMFLLAPSTRFGYFVYPLTLAIWVLAVLAQPDAHWVRRDPGEPPASGHTSRGTSSAAGSPGTGPAA